MKLPALLTADLHLTGNPRDEYRWGLFPWLVEVSKDEQARSIVISGDTLDAKDYHSATLLNRVVDAIASLRSGTVEDVYVLMGNHDYLVGGQPYLKFLNHIPGIRYIWKPTEDHDVEGPPAFFLPHTKTPAADWRGMDFSHYQYLFMHQTIKGAISSTGMALEGEDIPALNAGKVYSGDIHVPQVCGQLEYIGSPYHVHFGDKFEPRCILLDRRARAEDLYFPTTSRVTVKVQSLRELRRQRFAKGDQVKLRIQLTESERYDWQRIRREAVAWLADQGAQVCGVELLTATARRTIASLDVKARARGFSTQEAVERFVLHEEMGADALQLGLDLVEGV